MALVDIDLWTHTCATMAAADSSLYLQLGECTFERLAHSLRECAERDREECGGDGHDHRLPEDPGQPAPAAAQASSECTRKATCRRVSPSTSTKVLPATPAVTPLFSSSVGQHATTNLQGLGEVTYGLAGRGDSLTAAPFSMSFMMATPEDFFPGHTPKLNLGSQQTSVESLPSILSWWGSEAEGARSSSLELACLSPSSLVAASLGNSFISLGEVRSLSKHQAKGQINGVTSNETPPTRYQDCDKISTCGSHPAQHSSSQAQSQNSDARPQNSDARPQNPRIQPLHASIDHFLHRHLGSEGPGRQAPSRRGLLRDVVLGVSTAFRTHPLFPLLRDLTVTDHYYDKGSVNVALLLGYLPSSTNELVEMYLRRHPEAARAYQNPITSADTKAVDAVILEAIAYAHASLLEKIADSTAELSKAVEAETAEVEAAVEVMCQRFTKVVRSSTPVHLLNALDTTLPQQQPRLQTQQEQQVHSHQHKEQSGGLAVQSQMYGADEAFQQLEEMLVSVSPIPSSCLGYDSSSASPSLPEPRRRQYYSKEVIRVLSSWLLAHQHDPYPNEDQKQLLVQQTGLAVQQINQWFTNARRRLLNRQVVDQAT
ncbi:uncharacterized protein [Procambarus clarkii]|uniref:uncharacterized protein n=1 Tax=Procambarus clarkii TaxID=6728 RepID=UPI001E674EFA|nr:uncharacterized protein LOC123749541 [Procambarus clarkii]